MNHAFAAVSSFLKHSACSPELICTVDSITALRRAVDAGADAVQFRLGAGLRSRLAFNLDHPGLRRAIRHAQVRGVRIILMLPDSVLPGSWLQARDLVDQAVLAGIDALQIRDGGLLLYARASYPNLELHLSVPPCINRAGVIKRMHRQCGIDRAVIEKPLSRAELAMLCAESSVCIQGDGEALSRMTAGTLAAGSPANLPRSSASSANVLDQCGDIGEAANDGAFGPEADAASPSHRAATLLARLPLAAVSVSAHGRHACEVTATIDSWHRPFKRRMHDSSVKAASLSAQVGKRG